MKTALLVCDYVKPEFLHIDGDYPAMFENLFPNLELEVFFVCDNTFPQNVNDFHAYIVTGSSYSVYDPVDWIIRLKAFVKAIYEAKIPYIGVCFGHQLLGESLGGKVEKSAVGWCVGVHEFQILHQMEWMEPKTDAVNLLMSCQDQIVQLPPDTKVLASAAKCPYGMIQVGENMFGVQAHPEFSKAYNQALMQARISRIGEEVVQEGIASLKLPLHREILQSWIELFLAKTHIAY